MESVELDDKFWCEYLSAYIVVVAICGRAVGVICEGDDIAVKWVTIEPFKSAIERGELERRTL